MMPLNEDEIKRILNSKYCKTYYRKHGVAIRLWQREYHTKNHERILERGRQYRLRKMEDAGGTERTARKIDRGV